VKRKRITSTHVRIATVCVIAFTVVIAARRLTTIHTTTSPLPITELEYHEVLRLGRGTAESIAWSPDGETLAVGGSDGIYLYTPEFEDIAYFDDPVPVWRLAWSPDGRRIANLGQGLNVQIRDAQTGELQSTLAQAAGTYTLAWSPDSMRLAVSSGVSTEHEINIWDMTSGSLLLTLQNTERMTAITWSPDGNRIAASDWGEHITVWDTTSGEKLAQLSGPTSSLVWSPDGNLLAGSGSTYQSNLLLWDMNTYEPIPRINVRGFVSAIAWNPDGTELAGASSNNTIKIWDLSSGELLRSIDTHPDIISVSWTGNKLTALSRDHTITNWDAATGQQIASLQEHSNEFTRVVWRPNSNQLAVTQWEATYITIMDVFTGELQDTLETTFVPRPDFATDLLWSPDNTFLASAFELDDTINIWNVSGESHLVLEHPGSFRTVAWSPDSRLLATAWGIDDARELLIWEATTGNLVNKLNVPMLGWVQWSPDGNLLATYTWDPAQVTVWDANTFQSLNVIFDAEEAMTPRDLAGWNPDSTTLTGAKCGNVEDGCSLWQWDITTNAVSEPFENSHLRFRQSFNLAWSPDGRLFAASDEADRVVHIWDVATGALMVNLDGFANPVSSLSWSSDSRMLATSDGVIHIWSIEPIIS
jgi:WD40 repeat protein